MIRNLFKIQAMNGLMLLLSLGGVVNAQENTLQVEYQNSYQSHQRALLEIASKCEQLGKKGLADFTRSWVPPKDPARQYFYQLPGNRSLKFPDPVDQTDQFWLNTFRKMNQAYSGELLELAKRANNEKQFAFAFQLLHECLFCDPGNSTAQKILGESGLPMKIRVNDYRQRDRLLPTGSVSKYESDYFVLYTTVEKEVAESAIRKFEQWHGVWRQLFYTYWASSTWMSRRFQTTVKSSRRSKKFKVVLYPNREEYLAKLKPVEPGIGVSSGYYLFKEKTSFFYAGEGGSEKTWIHELTHQLMHESIPVSSKSSIRSSIWAVEGVAMYMESLQDFRTHVTVGGEDAERLNYCRHHYFREGFFVSMDTLNRMSQAEFVKHENVTALYSLSATYCHFLMREKKVNDEFLNFLRLVHQGKNSSVSFERIGQQVSFEGDFKGFLKPSKAKLRHSLINLENCRILSLGHSDVDDSILAMLENASQLESLDLGQTLVTNSGIRKLSGLKKLSYLSLEKTRVTDACMSTIGQMGSLEELDLTTTGITDQGVNEIGDLQNLIALWMGGTRISDRSVKLILELRSLKQVDIRETMISETGSKQLMSRLKVTD